MDSWFVGLNLMCLVRGWGDDGDADREEKKQWTEKHLAGTGDRMKYTVKGVVWECD